MIWKLGAALWSYHEWKTRTVPFNFQVILNFQDYKTIKIKEKYLSGVGFEPTHSYEYQSLNLAP